MRRTILLCLTAALVLLVGATVCSALTSNDFVGSYGKVYSLVWDGHKGELVLYPETLSTPSYLRLSDGRQLKVTHKILLNPQDNYSGMTGIGFTGATSSGGHRITFWVDFNNTPQNIQDDQRFEGYMMNQTRDAIAGVTWWNRIPFGFYAIFKYNVPG